VIYRVNLTLIAQTDVGEAYEWLAERTIHADEWFSGLGDAIGTLAQFPNRWPLAREGDEFKQPVRQLLYGSPPHVYRVLFVVGDGIVHVVRMRHSARAALQTEDIGLPPSRDLPH
jgi:hypothetical protein